jgi:hypothetical protein
MKTVCLYGGTGKYSGAAATEWNSPQVGDTHRFILFIAQEKNQAQQQIAINELEQFGFTELQVGEGKPITRPRS